MQYLDFPLKAISENHIRLLLKYVYLFNFIFLQNFKNCRVRIVSIDLPSGWRVDDTDNNSWSPDMVISLTAPKLCMKSYTGIHYIAGRFIPKSLEDKYDFKMPDYKNGDLYFMENEHLKLVNNKRKHDFLTDIKSSDDKLIPQKTCALQKLSDFISETKDPRYRCSVCKIKKTRYCCNKCSTIDKPVPLCGTTSVTYNQCYNSHINGQVESVIETDSDEIVPHTCILKKLSDVLDSNTNDPRYRCSICKIRKTRFCCGICSTADNPIPLCGISSDSHIQCFRTHDLEYINSLNRKL